MKRKLWLTFFFCLWASITLGIQPDELPELDPKFKPHMLDHDHEGCPPNAHCAKAYGEKRSPWGATLDHIRINKPSQPITALERQRQSSGLPITVWATPKSLALSTVASWNSPCRHHNLETGEIYLGEVMITHFNELPGSEESVIANRTWFEREQGTSAYLSLQGALPLAVRQNKLYYTREEKGVYYGLLVSEDGSLEISEVYQPPQAPREVHCPEKLTQVWKSWTQATQIYQRPYCRAIWDETRRTFQTHIVGWSC